MGDRPKRTPEQVAAELQELVREANGLIKDLRTEFKVSLKERIEPEVNAAIKALNTTVDKRIKQFAMEFNEGCEGIQAAMERRMAHIATMTGTDTRLGKILAATFLIDNDGTAELIQDEMTAHLVLEMPLHDGTGGSQFQFGADMKKRIHEHPEIAEEIAMGLVGDRQEFGSFPVIHHGPFGDE